MAFPVINYASSELMKSPVNDIINNMLSGFTQGKQAQYLEPTLAENLKKVQLANQYYGPNIESEMALRGAQAGHLGALTKKTGLETQYLPRQMEAQIQALEAQAQKARLLEMIREQMLGGGIPTQQSPTQAPPASMEGVMQGQGMFREPEAISPMPSYAQPSTTQSSAPSNIPFNPNYAKAAIAMQSLGMGMPKVTEINGKQIAITPFGNIDTGIEGLTEQEKSFQTNLGKNKATYYEEAVKQYNGLNNQGLALEEITHAIQNNPEFRNVVGRVNQPLIEWLGSPQQKQLLGDLRTASGEIALQIAPLLMHLLFDFLLLFHLIMRH